MKKYLIACTRIDGGIDYYYYDTYNDARDNAWVLFNQFTHYIAVQVMNSKNNLLEIVIIR